MRSYIVSIIAAVSAVSAQSATFAMAPVVTAEPAGVAYVGTLPAKAGSTLRGSITGTSATDGTGVKFQVSLSGLPAEGGPFLYHIHEKPVPSDGNCTGTGAHLDPYKRGETPPCDPAQPATCQTGDLSGKHGKITAQEWSQEYVDLYSATRANDVSFFGNLSFVVHLANKTRIGCANFTLLSAGSSSSGYMPYPSASSLSNGTVTLSATASTGKPISPSATQSTPSQFTGAASKIAGGSAAFLAAAAALML